MREIKFRAWETKEKRMLGNGGFDIHLYGSCDYGISHQFLDEGTRQYRFTVCKRNGFDERKTELILMQYTGLKDKHGKEIYEGDIIRFDTLVQAAHAKDRIKIAPVRYSEFGTMFRARTEYGDTQFYEGKYTEVIGNIYENPEKLK